MSTENVTQMSGREPAPDAGARALRILEATHPDAALAAKSGGSSIGDRSLIEDALAVVDLITAASHETRKHGNNLDSLRLNSLHHAGYLAVRLLEGALLDDNDGEDDDDE